MFSEAKVTQIYCMVDDFCKESAEVQKKNIWLKTRIISIRTNPTE